jgi:hypothetical protein
MSWVGRYPEAQGEKMFAFSTGYAAREGMDCRDSVRGGETKEPPARSPAALERWIMCDGRERRFPSRATPQAAIRFWARNAIGAFSRLRRRSSGEI